MSTISGNPASQRFAVWSALRAFDHYDESGLRDLAATR